jgi:adhesin/invasin
MVADAFSNPVTGVAVTFAVASGVGSVTGSAATTNASGIATVGSWTLGTTSGTNTLTATAGAGTPVTFAVTFTATGVAGQGTMTVTAGNNQTTTVNTTVAVAPSVTIKDVYNNPLVGTTVIFAASGGGSVTGGTTTTDASGVATVGSWTLGTTAGSNSLTVSSAGVIGSPQTISATGTPGAPQAMTINAGNGQSAPAGTPVATPPSVLVVDQFNNPVSGVAVTFSVVAGGSVTGPFATTNASGIATAGGWTLGSAPGTNTLTATSAAVQGVTVLFTATGTTLTATTIAIDAGNGQKARAGTAVATPPSVIVTDDFGNPVGGVSVTFAVASGGGSITGATAVTNAAGIAVVGSWTLGSKKGPNSLTATSGNLSGSPVTFTATGQ